VTTHYACSHVKLSYPLPNTVTLKDLIKCKGSTSARL
jgi:hypothetical protein